MDIDDQNRIMIELKFFPVVVSQEYLDMIPEFVKVQLKRAWPITVGSYGNELTVDCMRTIIESYANDFENKLRFRLYQYYDGHRG